MYKRVPNKLQLKIVKRSASCTINSKAEHLTISYFNLLGTLLYIKGTLPQNIFIFKKMSHMSYKLPRYRWFAKIFLKISRNCNSCNYLVPQTMSPLQVRSKVCMAVFHVRSKVCIASIHVRSKLAAFAPHMDGNMQTLLRTWKGAMQTLLCTWSGGIRSGTKNS